MQLILLSPSLSLNGYAALWSTLANFIAWIFITNYEPLVYSRTMITQSTTFLVDTAESNKGNLVNFLKKFTL